MSADDQYEVKSPPPARARWRPTRSLVASVGVCAALIAAIALVNRDDTEGGTQAGQTTARYSHNEAGAQSAAKHAAQLIGSERMFSDKERQQVLESVMDPTVVDRLQRDDDRAYRALGDRLGLGRDGTPPSGQTFVSTTTPLKITTKSYTDTRASVAVWCSGVLGLTGKGATVSPRTSWFTMRLDLTWGLDGWRVHKIDQTQGPNP
ncbi:hypothetical protein [Streptomyces natalensis]|uniref:hypothetical protein n=1 Tax=Streptomyces natalensis TaxID=68242 RepID=UPI0006904207|nr:hypothetical protein [Streptomyces natalensis]